MDDKIKCITFDPEAQNALPEHIKEKMRADREKARRRKLPYDINRSVFIQHDYDFYSTVYYADNHSEPVFYLKNNSTGEFERLSYGRSYMVVALEKLQKLSPEEKARIDKELVNNFWWAIREGFNHMLDPNLKREYDTPRIQNTLKAVKSYIDKIVAASKKEMEE